MASIVTAIGAVAGPVGIASNFQNVFYTLLTAIDTYEYNSQDARNLHLLVKQVLARYSNLSPDQVSHHHQASTALHHVCDDAVRWCTKYNAYSRLRRFCFASHYATKFAHRWNNVIALDDQLFKDLQVAKAFELSFKEYTASSDGSHSPEIHQ